MSSSDISADTIYVGATIITMDPVGARAEAFAVRGRLITAVGSDGIKESCRGPDTRLVDLRGRTVVPGFHDAHCHLMASVARMLGVDCSPDKAHSIQDIQALVRQGAGRLGPEDWIRATGYNEFYLREKRHPDRRDLDMAAPDRPVRLLHRSGHAMVLSSRALSIIGITAATSDPPGGIIERDRDGEPTGLLFGATDYWDGFIPHPPEDEMRRGLGTLLKKMVSTGITAVQDATASNGYEKWCFIREMDGQSELPLRVTMMLGVDKMGEFTECGCATRPETGNVGLGAVKIIVDETAGEVYPAPSDLEQMLLSAHLAGFQTAQHAVEGRALETAVEVLGRVLGRVPSPVRRHRIEHCSLCHQSLRRRIGELGAVVVTQPSFIYFNGERYLDTVPVACQSDLYPVRALMREGVVVAAGSDSPVAGYEPLLGILTAVTRRAANGSLIAPEEAVSPDAALAMYTRNAAYSSFNDRLSGSLEVGKSADFVVLSADPTRCEAEAIGDVRVEATVLGGRVVYEA